MLRDGCNGQFYVGRRKPDLRPGLSVIWDTWLIFPSVLLKKTPYLEGWSPDLLRLRHKSDTCPPEPRYRKSQTCRTSRLQLLIRFAFDFSLLLLSLSRSERIRCDAIQLSLYSLSWRKANSATTERATRWRSKSPPFDELGAGSSRKEGEKGHPGVVVRTP
jgi:hypothetical protein